MIESQKQFSENFHINVNNVSHLVHWDYSYEYMNYEYEFIIDLQILRENIFKEMIESQKQFNENLDMNVNNAKKYLFFFKYFFLYETTNYFSNNVQILFQLPSIFEE